jgi:hypothetical protein
MTPATTTATATKTMAMAMDDATAMDGATATRRQRLRRVKGKWRRATQDATKGDATTSHRSEREANERRKRRRTRGCAVTTRKGTWSFFLGEADLLCPRALMAIHRAYCEYGSGPLVMAMGGGGGGGDPAAFVVVAAPRVVVSAPVVVVVAHRPSPFPYATECLLPDRC